MTAPSFEIETRPRPEDVQFLDDKLTEYNFEATGITDGQLLSIFVRDEEGVVAAGLYGWTWGGACEIRSLWVRQDWRGRGLGRDLLMAAEEEARKRGCSHIFLDTHSFQAPEFYKKYGFQVAGVYEDYPKGHQKIFLQKDLG